MARLSFPEFSTHAMYMGESMYYFFFHSLWFLLAIIGISLSGNYFSMSAYDLNYSGTLDVTKIMTNEVNFADMAIYPSIVFVFVTFILTLLYNSLWLIPILWRKPVLISTGGHLTIQIILTVYYFCGMIGMFANEFHKFCRYTSGNRYCHEYRAVAIIAILQTLIGLGFLYMTIQEKGFVQPLITFFKPASRAEPLEATDVEGGYLQPLAVRETAKIKGQEGVYQTGGMYATAPPQGTLPNGENPPVAIAQPVEFLHAQSHSKPSPLEAIPSPTTLQTEYTNVHHEDIKPEKQKSDSEIEF